MTDDRTAMVNWVKKALSSFQDSPLTDAQCSLVDQFLQGKTIAQAAKDSGYSQSHAKRVSADISEAIALAMGELEPINKSSWQPKIRDYLRQQADLDSVEGEGAIAHPSIPNQNFVGREGAIDSLNTHINQGAKIIVIQAPGGVGKTTLAQEYLKSQGFDLVVELLMAKEKENITPVESAIEEWLKQDFQEEPGREFGITLARLKRQLQTRRVGVLIDNLEPALDGQGRFIEPHRLYVELLRVLADSSVQSVTLITSREPLAECGGVTNYSLPSLNEQAWEDFFSRCDIDIDATTLKEMHKAYGGNALAMNILCAPIQRDGGMVAYWREYQVEAGLLVELAVENLVKEQFKRLEEIYPEAYKLLCRLGCYRYQDVPTIPTEGLFCLLWDVPERQKRRVIKSLRNLSLVEFQNREYWLHPVIREEAISRLRASECWEEANRKAAEFWKDSVKTVETIKDALTAFEAYYHYLKFDNFDGAADVIDQGRQNKFDISEPLGIAFYRLGLLQQMKLAINKIINKINPGYVLSSLHNILGDIYWFTGDIKNSIESHERSRIIATDFQILSLEIVSFMNIGLCQIDLLEIEKGIALFEKVILMAENTDCHTFAAQSYYCLAFLNSCLDLKYESLEFAHKSSEPAYFTAWSLGYRLLFLGQTYNNLKEVYKSFEMYREAIQFAEETHYTQVRAKALSGLAELYRIQEDFTTALSHHSESIALLDKIGAKCDLAEAHYQLALTYQKMGDAEKSQTPFQEAIRLFTEMEAPKQVEKVQKAIGNSDEV